jgi:hypothetical protein
MKWLAATKIVLFFVNHSIYMIYLFDLSSVGFSALLPAVQCVSRCCQVVFSPLLRWFATEVLTVLSIRIVPFCYVKRQLKRIDTFISVISLLLR